MSVSRVRTAVEIGLTIALSAVLSFIAVWEMPQGGSVSFAMMPLFVLAILRGPAIGLTAGGMYGVVDFMLKPYFFHPAQVALDYPIAYAACGLAGLLAARWRSESDSGRTMSGLWTAVVPGIAIGAFGRYVAHMLSGLVFFSSYAVEAGQAPLVYSAAYNSFVLVSAVGCAILAFPVLPPLQRLYGSRTR